MQCSPTGRTGSVALRGSLQAVRRVALVVATVFAIAAQTSGDHLAQRVRNLVQTYERISTATVGVSIRHLPSGLEPVSIRGGDLFVPASCQKLLTAAAAMERLGGGFQFTTSVYVSGSDVVVIGDFDPTLGDPRIAQQQGISIYHELDRWARAVAERVGQTPVGSLLLVTDGSVRTYRHPDWPVRQHQRWFAAPAGELNFHNNCLDVSFRVKGRSATASVTPSSRFIRIDSRVKVAKRHVWSLGTGSDLSVVKLAGSVSRSTPDPLSVAIDDPAALLGRVLADRLARHGVSLAGQIRSVKADQVDLSRASLVCQTTTPIELVLRRANKRSLNLAAECLFLRAGDGTWAGSATIATQILTKRYGLDPKGFRICDGSGLSRKARVAPSTLTQLLVGLVRRSEGDKLIDSLPKSGIDGTMVNRLNSGKYRGRVLAKTGSLAGVSGLAGYVLDSSGTPAAVYAILINGVSAKDTGKTRALQDAICRALVDSLEANPQNN